MQTTYAQLPELVAMMWMALVLLRLQRWRANLQLQLWVAGLVLIVMEGLARVVYLGPSGPRVHAFAHIVALNTYLFAGAVFLYSATRKLWEKLGSRFYLAVGIAPHFVLLTLYGANVHARAVYAAVAVAGGVAGIVTALVLRRPAERLLIHALIWAPLLLAINAGNFRLMAYVSLFLLYISTGFAFYRSLPPERRGRAIVCSGFVIWSLCFLSHPWVATVHPEWLRFAEEIWDLQKFFVVFGLLTVTLEEQSARSEYEALHDTLTGLPNRRLFEDRLEQALVRANRNGTRVVLFNMDLNDFKRVNDTLGHEAGDEVLREVGRRLATVKRETDTLARMGGDEFYLLINDFNVDPGPEGHSPSLSQVREQCCRLMETFRRSIESSPCLLNVGDLAEELQCTVSIGGGVFPEEATTPKGLVRIADSNMYTDKKHARGKLKAAVTH